MSTPQLARGRAARAGGSPRRPSPRPCAWTTTIAATRERPCTAPAKLGTGSRTPGCRKTS